MIDTYFKIKKNIIKKLILLLIIFLFNSLNCTCSARYLQTSKVKYRTNIGFSQYYTIDVTFYTGQELSKLSNSYNYDAYSKYAIIFWNQNQTSVIKLSTYITCSGEFEIGCLPYNGMLDGNDLYGRKWVICTTNLCL